VRVRVVPWLIGLLVVCGVCVSVYYWAKAAGWLTPVDRVVRPWEASNNGFGIKSKIVYPAEPTPVVAVTHPRDLTQEQLETLKRELAAQRALLEAMHKRPQQAQMAATQPKPPPPATKHRPMLFITNKVESSDASEPDTYPLAPGATKLPCVVETAINSDVGDSFWTAKVRNDIYDTATGHRLLIPQGSTILGKASGSVLLYGNERIPTFSLTLSLPDGRSMDLGQAPATDQQGMAGLTGNVDQHYWRLFGPVFIGGARRGGTQAVMTEAAGAGAAGQVAAGMAGTAGQATQQRLGRALDTRPTIEVDAGSLCQVLLIKPLHLPAVARR
jgi:type IV secretory pathway VirB10-like protein